MNRQKMLRAAKKVLFFVVILMMIILLLFPVVAMISVSLKRQNDVFSRPVTWIPPVLAPENYVEVFRKMDVLAGFRNSLVVSGGSIALIMLVGIPAAYALSKLDFWGKGIIYYITLVSQMFAPIIVIIPLYKVMNSWGLIDNHTSLILMNTTFNLAFIVLMLKSTFDNVPREIVESATIDGCNKLETMLRVVLPVASTGIAVAVIFAFTRTWNEFLFAFTFISGTPKKTIIVKLYEILKNNPAVGIPWNLVMSGAVITTVPLVILFLSIRNYITGDATKGAIK